MDLENFKNKKDDLVNLDFSEVSKFLINLRQLKNAGIADQTKRIAEEKKFPLYLDKAEKIGADIREKAVENREGDINYTYEIFFGDKENFDNYVQSIIKSGKITNTQFVGLLQLIAVVKYKISEYSEEEDFLKNSDKIIDAVRFSKSIQDLFSFAEKKHKEGMPVYNNTTLEEVDTLRKFYTGLSDAFRGKYIREYLLVNKYYEAYHTPEYSLEYLKGEATEKEFADYWEKAISDLKSLKGKENLQDLFFDLLDHLANGIEICDAFFRFKQTLSKRQPAVNKYAEGIKIIRWAGEEIKKIESE